MTTKTILIQGIAPGVTIFTLTTTKTDAIEASCQVKVIVAAREVLTITSTSYEVNVIEGKQATIEINYTGDQVAITGGDEAIAKMIIQQVVKYDIQENYE